MQCIMNSQAYNNITWTTHTVYRKKKNMNNSYITHTYRDKICSQRKNRIGKNTSGQNLAHQIHYEGCCGYRYSLDFSNKSIDSVPQLPTSTSNYKLLLWSFTITWCWESIRRLPSQFVYYFKTSLRFVIVFVVSNSIPTT